MSRKLLSCSYALILIISILLTGSAKGFFGRIEDEKRPVVSLNGMWEIYTVKWGGNEAFDPNVVRDSIVFPQYGMGLGPAGNGKDIQALDNACYWLVKTVNVPAEFSGKQIFVVLRHANFAVDVFVNDVNVLSFAGISSPMQTEITLHIKPGRKNTIRLKLRDWRAGMNPDKAYKATPAYGYLDKPVGSMLYPVNMQFVDGCIGIKDDVYLAAVNEVFVDDIFVKPSYRTKTLTADVTLANLSSSVQKIAVKAEVCEVNSGQSVLAFDDQFVELAPGEHKTITVSKAWSSPRLWHPANPYLYNFKAELVRKGTMLDRKRQRFGFREVWTSGPKIMLNGYPVKLFQLGTFMTAMDWYDIDPVKRAQKIRKFYQENVLDVGLNCVRWSGGVLPQIYADIADELGVMITTEPDLTHAFGADFLSEVFWKNAYANAEGFARLYRNNPSVVVLSAGNEIMITAYHNDIKDMEYSFGKYFHLQEIFKKIDGTRPVMFEGNGALAGRDVDIYNNHAYEPENCREWPLYSFVAGKGLNLEYHANPATDFWGGKKVELASKPWTKDKPMIIGETFSMYKLPAECYSYVGGEEVYRNMHTDMNGYIGVGAELLVNIVAGYRYNDVAGIDPWYLFPMNKTRPSMATAQRQAYKLACIYPYDRFSRYFAGSKAVKRFVLFNDAYDPCAAKISLKWSLLKDGGIVDSGQTEVGLVMPGSSPMAEAVFDVPGLPGAYTMRTVMVRNGSEADVITTAINVWPDIRERKLEVNTAISCYDPAGKTVAVLKGMAANVCAVESPAAGDGRAIMVIGECSYDDLCGKKSKELLGWVAKGGRLLVLGQEYASAPFNLDFAVDHGPTYTSFVRAKGHPVFKGIDSDDILTWANDFTVGFNSLRKFAKMSMRSLADTGYGHDGLVLSTLSEQSLGKGTILYCQFRVVERYNVEPAAGALLRNMLQYLGAKPVVAPSPLLYGGGDVRAGQLKNFGVDLIKLCDGDELKADAALWLDGGDANSAAWLAMRGRQVKAFVEKGGTMFIDAAKPPVIDSFNRCFAARLTLALSQMALQHLEYGPGQRERLLWGLSLFDFTWDSYAPPFYREKLIEHKITASSCSGEMVALLVEPPRIGHRTFSWCKYMSIDANQPGNAPNADAGYSLIKYSLGSGAVYISMLELGRGLAGGEPEKAARITGNFLNNLGIEMDLNKVNFEMAFPVKAENFVPVGKAIGSRGYSGQFINC